jgi:hypothetical protein
VHSILITHTTKAGSIYYYSDFLKDFDVKLNFQFFLLWNKFDRSPCLGVLLETWFWTLSSGFCLYNPMHAP